MYYKAYKFRIYPNESQKNLSIKHLAVVDLYTTTS